MAALVNPAKAGTIFLTTTTAYLAIASAPRAIHYIVVVNPAIPDII